MPASCFTNSKCMTQLFEFYFSCVHWMCIYRIIYVYYKLEQSSCRGRYEVYRTAGLMVEFSNFHYWTCDFRMSSAYVWEIVRPAGRCKSVSIMLEISDYMLICGGFFWRISVWWTCIRAKQQCVYILDFIVSVIVSSQWYCAPWLYIVSMCLGLFYVCT